MDGTGSLWSPFTQEPGAYPGQKFTFYIRGKRKLFLLNKFWHPQLLVPLFIPRWWGSKRQRNTESLEPWRVCWAVPLFIPITGGEKYLRFSPTFITTLPNPPGDQKSAFRALMKPPVPPLMGQSGFISPLPMVRLGMGLSPNVPQCPSWDFSQ